MYKRQTLTVTQAGTEEVITTTSSLIVSSINDFDADGNSQTVDVTANVDWSVTEDSSWITLDTTSGSNDGSFIITTEQNTAIEDRSATITIEGNGIIRILTVTQAGAEEIITPTSSLIVSSINEFDADGNSQTVDVTANVDWSVVEDSSWITVDTTSGSNDGSFIITTEQNTVTEDRSATITISGEDISRSIIVTQTGAEEIITTPSSNLAVDGIATQSSTSHNGVPSRAIDGNTNGIYSATSVTHTTATTNSWWQVQLASQTNIGDIVIYNRTNNCCMDRLSNFTVSVLDSNNNEVFSQTITETPNPSITINAGGTLGSVVRIHTNLTNTALSLAEVEVYASDDESFSSESCPEETNLSLNATIVDFSTQQNTANTVENIIDDIDTNRWSAFGFPQYATIDLGEEYSVDEINLLGFQNRDYQFTVEGSVTSANDNFFALVDASNNTSSGIINETFPAQTVRYVKLTITGANSYTGSWSSIADFKIICSGTTVDNKDVFIEKANLFEITAFPNPFIETITVKANNPNQQIGSLQLTDLTGRVIIEETVNANEYSLENLDLIADGVYVLLVFNAEKQILKSIKIVNN